MAQTQSKPEIRRKEQIPEEHRTPDRDEAAEYIEDMWPATLGEISDESGYSISHVHNTLDKYFDRVTNDENDENGSGNGDGNHSNDVGARSMPGLKEKQVQQPVEEVQERRHEVDVPDAYLDSPAKLQAYLHGWGDGFIYCRLDCVNEDGGNGGQQQDDE